MVPDGSALALTGNSHNGDYLTFHIAGTGFSDFVISYASRRTSTVFGLLPTRWART